MRRAEHRRAYAELGTALHEARTRAGLTQVEVARRLGRPQSFVAKYEDNERRLDVIEFLTVVRAIGTTAEPLLRRVARHLPRERPR